MNEFISMFLDRRNEVLQLFLTHVNMTAESVILSLVIGIPLGLVITKNKTAAKIVIGLANIMQSLPSIGLLALLVPFIGIGQKPAVAMVIVYSLLPIIKSTYTGLTGVDQRMMEAARGIGLSGFQTLFRVQLPLAAPYIMSGIRISAVTAVGTVTIAAFAGAGGLGWLINLGLNANDANLVLLGAVPACLLALGTDWVLGAVERLVIPPGLLPSEQIEQLTAQKRFRNKISVVILTALILFVPARSLFTSFAPQTEKKITVGSSNFTEVITLGCLYSEFIEKNTDIKVERKFALKGSTVCFPALQKGDIDMYVDYTGTAATAILKEKLSSDPAAVYKVLHDKMAERGVDVSKPLGFENTYVMSASPAAAERYGLKTLSDLFAHAGDLHLGCTSYFTQREDLLTRIEKEFNVHFKKVTGLEGNVRYQAITSGQIDVTDAYSTDAMTVKTKLVPLKDDSGFFPPYEGVNMVSMRILKKYPKLKPLLQKLDGQISTEEMAQMNYEVDIEKKTPQQAAHEFLLRKGLIK